MQVERIYVFPVKSLKGISVSESPIDEYGFKHDRMYALAWPQKDGSHAVLTQRQLPKLARIHTEIDGSELVMSYNENGRRGEARLPLDLAELPADMPQLSMELWGHDMVCGDVGARRPELKRFLAEFVGADLKYDGLTLIVSQQRRSVPPNDAASVAYMKDSGRAYTSSFQDLFPGTLMTTASFEELAHMVQLKDGVQIDERSFRMNLVVRTDEAWVEDDWKRVRVGEHEWFVDRLCERCSMPAVDQDSGTIREAKQPLPELNRFRIMEKGKTPCFGLCLFCKDAQFNVRVGDRVEVLEEQA